MRPLLVVPDDWRGSVTEWIAKLHYRVYRRADRARWSRGWSWLHRATGWALNRWIRFTK